MPLVNDEPDALALASVWLEKLGRMVRPRTAPQEAQHLPLTDMVMQLRSGPALAEAVRNLQPRIGILCVSGFANLQEPKNTAIADAHLVEPFSQQEFVSAVFAALEQSPE